MPDALYLYTTGYWKDNTTRQERIGSVALDYVGKCFNDGQYPQCCLIVKFACHPGEFNDNKKWYVYPHITDDDDIWNILRYYTTNEYSVGKGYHKQVHPFLDTTEFERITPPTLRFYISYWILHTWDPIHWHQEKEGWAIYKKLRSFADITTEYEVYSQTAYAPSGFFLYYSYLHSTRNANDGANNYNLDYRFVDRIKDVQESAFYPMSESYDGTVAVGVVNPITITGKIYNSSIILSFYCWQENVNPNHVKLTEKDTIKLIALST